MHLSPVTAVVLLKYLKGERSFHSNLLTSTPMTSGGLLEIKMQHHFSDFPDDIALSNFSFENFSHEVLNKDPNRDVTIGGLIKWVLQSIYPHPSNKLLITAFQHFSREKSAFDLFSQTLNHPEFDKNYKEALFEFISFGRTYLLQILTPEEQEKNIHYLIHMMTGVLLNTVYGESYFDNPNTHAFYMDIFSPILHTCLSLSDKNFENAWSPKTAEKEAAEPSFFKKTFKHFKHTSSVPLHSSSSSTSHSIFSPILSILSISPSVSPSSLSPNSPFFLPPRASLILPGETTPRLFLSKGSKEEKTEEKTQEMVHLSSLIKQGDLMHFEAILFQKSDPQQYINSTFIIFGRSFLQIAAIDQKTDFIHSLYKLNADISHQDKHGQTVYHFAAKWKKFDSDCFNALLLFPNAWEVITTIEDHKNQTALDLMQASEFKDAFLSYQPKEKQKIKLH